ncbi:uncharacterized protein BYT42DRAFT_614739 [Radiomyces spectabilis]|uniref:uncharacterized protein n=1 Tax=Radiomyces spectabilis TaxID=64574 RepID=UPI0022210AC8|nr:uncharacterized protein BYT42DRAFT_614739 [Radiomyces spectabilis]KAI8375945.1 hypothetical protein BYT42DRAFT_614739 [Radiomyces spectabilis]
MSVNTSSLPETVVQIGKAFDTCLESLLVEPQLKKDDQEELTEHVKQLKSLMLDVEKQIKDIRLRAMGNEQLSLSESVTLLKRDIAIKKEAVSKYSEKLDIWSEMLPALKNKSLEILRSRADGNDTAEPAAASAHPASSAMEDDEDDDDDVEFEEI